MDQTFITGGEKYTKRKHIFQMIHGKTLSLFLSNIRWYCPSADGTDTRRRKLFSAGNRGSGLAIGQTVSGICPCTGPTDKSWSRILLRPIRDFKGRVQASSNLKPIQFWLQRADTDPGFRSGTRQLPGNEMGNGDLRVVVASFPFQDRIQIKWNCH